MTAEQTRDELRHSRAAAVGRRRAVIGVSLVGMASMAATSLLQTGLIRHLPDPPLPGFDSDKVNLSRRAFPFGVPDGTLALLAFAANLPLAASGGADRARRAPWVPLLAGAKALVDAAVAGWYFYQMPAKEKAWCGYCVTAALADFAMVALTLPEAMDALAAMRDR